LSILDLWGDAPCRNSSRASEIWPHTVPFLAQKRAWTKVLTTRVEHVCLSACVREHLCDPPAQRITQQQVEWNEVADKSRDLQAVRHAMAEVLRAFYLLTCRSVGALNVEFNLIRARMASRLHYWKCCLNDEAQSRILMLLLLSNGSTTDLLVCERALSALIIGSLHWASFFVSACGTCTPRRRASKE
jgi:hypothetical protein